MAIDLGVHRLLRPICLHTQGKALDKRGVLINNCLIPPRKDYSYGFDVVFQCTIRVSGVNTSKRPLMQALKVMGFTVIAFPSKIQ